MQSDNINAEEHYTNIEITEHSDDLQRESSDNVVRKKSGKCKWSHVNRSQLLAAVMIALIVVSFISIIVQIRLAETTITTKSYHDTKDVLDILTDIQKDVDDLKGRDFYRNLRDCSDLQNGLNGVYRIIPDTRHAITVYCDMITEDVGLTVVQRRLNGKIGFYRGWNEYKQGFGDLYSEFWIGNDILHTMTSARDYTLRIDLEDFSGNKTFATYSVFKVANESSKYRLHVGDYVGTAGDSFGKDDGAFFSTFDRDNDDYGKYHCAKKRTAGWWFKSCGASNINGIYRSAGYKVWNGIYWWAWHELESLKSTTLSIKPT